MRRLSILFCLVFFYISSYAQVKTPKFFIEAASGAGGTIFATRYDEYTPSNVFNYKAYLNKNFLGTAQEYAFGIHLNERIDLKVGYNRQRFTRKVSVDRNLNGVDLLFQHKIQHVDNSIFAAVTKKYQRKKAGASLGIGLGYLITQAQVEEIYTRSILNKEDHFKEIISYAELGYFYRFQPKVDIGVKAQAWWIVSGSYFNSVALLPYVRLNF